MAVWLPFAILAAWQARMILFLAVVAAPITALNFQDFLASLAAKKTGRQGDKETRRQLSFSSLLISVSLCLLPLPAVSICDAASTCLAL